MPFKGCLVFFKFIIERIVLTTPNRKHEWNNLFFYEENKRENLLFYFDVIRRRLPECAYWRVTAVGNLKTCLNL